MTDDSNVEEGGDVNNTPPASILNLVVYPDRRLHNISTPVETFNEQIKSLVRNMYATMHAHNGVGLAAIQVGVSKRVLIIEIERGKPMTFINPVIVGSNLEGKVFEWEEGCLSVPGYFEKRKRLESVVVRYQDVEGVEHETELKRLYAFALQHEMDHLDGTTFIDSLSALKRDRIKTKIEKQQKKAALTS